MHSTFIKNWLFLFLSILVLQSQVSAQCFTESADAAGIEGFWGTIGFTGGGGVSFVDFNDDGFDDLSFTSTSGSDLMFYTNNGDGTFSEVVPSLVSNTDETKSILWIDYDNDGDKDLFITAFEAPNRLYENDGNLNFTDVTLEVGLPLDNATTMGANFGDIDLDGYLDLYITNYGPGSVADTNTLYQNLAGTFVDITASSGTANYCDPATGGTLCDSSLGRQSFCSTFFDFDHDGDQDLYVSNDRMFFANSLYENNGDGTFTDVAIATHSNIQICSMNAGVGDSNGDGNFDIYSTNIGPSAHLVYDPINNAYNEDAAVVGTILNRLGWGGNFFDFDNDQDQDLYVCVLSTTPIEPSAMFVNDGTGNYTEPFEMTGGLDGVDYVSSHCNAIGDYDNDGNLDIVVTHIGSTNFFLFNSCEDNSNNYVKFDLEGTVSNRDAFGAIVEVYNDNGKYQINQKRSHDAYLTQNSGIVHFGIGSNASVDSVIIKWPFEGSVTKLYQADVMINAVNTVTETYIAGGGPPPAGPGTQCYTDHTSDAGISGGFGQSIAEGSGGVSFVDFNDDGFDDLSFTTEAGQPVMFYTNDGDGSFTLVDPPYISNTDESKNILWIDYDNDGDKDIFLTCYNKPNRLFQNDGNNNFNDVTTDVGLPINDQYTYGANFGDIDEDGFLDLYITNHGPPAQGESNYLYKNNGGVSFTDITAISGTSNGAQQSFCSVFFDYDHDGDLDIYLSNNKTGFINGLLENDGTGIFTDVSLSSGSGIAINSTNVGIGDCDNNGYFDIYCTDLTSSGHLMNQGDGTFQDEATERGTVFNRVGRGGSFYDYDNDSDLDLYVNSVQNGGDTPNGFFENDGEGFFTEPLALTGGLEGSDTLSTFCNAIGDIDNDGNMDIVTTGDFGNDFVLWKSCETNGNNFIKLKLEGTLSNKDAYGALIKIYLEANQFVTHKFNAQSYLAQHSDLIHFGIGYLTSVDSIYIDWPYPDSDTTLMSNELLVNGVNHIIENNSLCAIGVSCDDGDPCTAGETLDANCDCSGGTILDQDEDGICDLDDPCPTNPDPDCIDFPTVDPDLNIVRKWNEMLLESIRLDLARPTVHARNLFHTSIAMWDVFSVYNDPACPYLLGNVIGDYTNNFEGFTYTGDLNENMETSLSFACYRLLSHRFANSPNAVSLQEAYDYLMLQLGYDITITTQDYTTGDPAQLGNYIAEEIINFGLQDGANEIIEYANDYYEPVNESLIMDDPGNPTISNYNRWQPLTLETYIDQSGNVIPIQTPDFLSPEWGQVYNFALEDTDLTSYFRDGFEYKVYHDPGQPPQFNLDGSGDTDLFQWAFTLVSKWSSHLDPTDGVMIDISPVSQGNLGTLPPNFEDYDGFYLDEGGTPSNGYTVNPNTGLPYQTNVVPRGDFSRVLAEFWADGPDSETPPGHWFTLLNSVSDHPQLEKKFEGTGPELEDTEWYIKSYFAMGGAMHDAAISAWGAKGWYDYIRPVSAIRAMADLGQSSDATLPNYHVAGIPLTDGMVELVLAGDPLVGANNEHLNKIKLLAWLGHDAIDDEEVDEAGVGWILAENWAPYQRASFVTPPFAGYVSGHSTFSRAAAEVMTMLTGDEYFPGGLGTFLAKKDEFLVFEDGPSIDIELQWATYRDAAEQSALSRIWGGIHPPFDDLPGREIGLVVGTNAFNKAKSFFENIDSDGDGFCGLSDPDDSDPCIPDNSSCTECMIQDLNDAEFGWSIWHDGGADASRPLNSAVANSGSYSFLIKDNTTTSVITTDAIDFSTVEQVIVDFNFIATGFNNTNQDFWLQVSLDGGTTYSTLKDWVYNLDFVNNSRVFENVVIQGPFTSNTKLRFRCDASGNNDKVFIDDIQVETCGSFEATCDDGIQNGDETGIDCGGSSCSSCVGCNTISSNDGELGWGDWIDGGDDAALSFKPNYSNSGEYAFLIKDNTATSIITSTPFDLSNYDYLELSFNYISTGFNKITQDFWLEYSEDGGNNFTVIEEWNYNNEFQNEIREFESLNLFGPFTSEVVFRFRCDADSNNDKIYIDDINIEGCYGTAPIMADKTESRFQSDDYLDFEFYPNPSQSNQGLILNISSNADHVNLEISDLFGRVLKSKVVASDDFKSHELGVLNLEVGSYLIKVESKDQHISKKMLIIN